MMCAMVEKLHCKSNHCMELLFFCKKMDCQSFRIGVHQSVSSEVILWAKILTLSKMVISTNFYSSDCNAIVSVLVVLSKIENSMLINVLF